VRSFYNLIESNIYNRRIDNESLNRLKRDLNELKEEVNELKRVVALNQNQTNLNSSQRKEQVDRNIQTPKKKNNQKDNNIQKTASNTNKDNFNKSQDLKTHSDGEQDASKKLEEIPYKFMKDRSALIYDPCWTKFGHL